MAGLKSNSGRKLCKQWGVNSRGYFDKNGSWYHIPISFPAALCDPKGYVNFPTEAEFKNCSELQIGIDLHVPGGISALNGYKKMVN
jgi:hypothetical protein